MPKLTPEFLKLIAEDVNSSAKIKLRDEDRKKFFFYNGATKDIIKQAIMKEFKKPETLEELMGRLVPLNILKKTVDKLAMVYLETPNRSTVDGNENDEELIHDYENGMRLDSRMKEANRYFKLFKRNLLEIYVNEIGIPSLRNLPRHTYEVYSYDTVTVHVPNVVVKILKDDIDHSKQLLYVVTDQEAKTIDGNGSIIQDPMNPQGVNIYGKMPFVYLNEATYSVNPIGEDDMLGVAIVVPVLLTDLLFACKYQCFSVLWTVGVTGDIPFSPNSVIQADFGPNGERPSVDTIKPEVDSDKVIGVVNSLVSIYLSSRSLQANAITTKLDLNASASGVSKMFDSAESIEDRKDQFEYFYNFERAIWLFISNYGVNVWRKQKALIEKFNKEFSKEFEIQVEFTEPKIMMSEQEKVSLSRSRRDAGLSTLEYELRYLYPEYSDDEIYELEESIQKETFEKLMKLQGIEDSDGMEPDAKT